MAEFSCTTHTSPGVAVIHAAGDLDLAAVGPLWAQIGAHLIPGTRVVLDCSAVTFCDSAGLQVLMNAHRHAGESGAFALAGIEGPMARVLELTGLTDHFLTDGSRSSRPGQFAGETAGSPADVEPQG